MRDLREYEVEVRPGVRTTMQLSAEEAKVYGSAAVPVAAPGPDDPKSAAAGGAPAKARPAAANKARVADADK